MNRAQRRAVARKAVPRDGHSSESTRRVRSKLANAMRKEDEKLREEEREEETPALEKSGFVVARKKIITLDEEGK